MNLLKRFLLFFILGFGIMTTGCISSNKSSETVSRDVTVENVYRAPNPSESFTLKCDYEKLTKGWTGTLSLTVETTATDIDTEKLTMVAPQAVIISRTASFVWTAHLSSISEDNFLFQVKYIDEIVAEKYITVGEAEKTAFDWMKGILNSAVGTTLSITGLLTILGRTVLGIYKKGQGDKKLLVTKDEEKKFEAEMRRDMRGYASQIQTAVTDSVLRIVDTKLKDIDVVKDTAMEMKLLSASMGAEVKNINEKYSEIKNLSDSYRVLNNKVTRLEYGESANMERRSEK